MNKSNSVRTTTSCMLLTMHIYYRSLWVNYNSDDIHDDQIWQQLCCWRVSPPLTWARPLLAGLHTQSDPKPYVRTLIILAFVCFLMATTVLDVWVTDVSVTGYKKDTGRRRAWVSSPVLLYTLSCARRVEATPSYGCALAFVRACQWHQRPRCQSGNSKASTLSSAKKKAPIRYARKHTRHM